MWSDVLRRPLLMLAVIYAVAIAYERYFDIEILKPYRIIGLVLVLGAALTKGLRMDRIGKLTAIFLSVGFLKGVIGFGSPGALDSSFLNTVIIWVFNLMTYLAIVSIIRSRQDVLLLGGVHALAILSTAYGIAAEAAKAEFLMRISGDFGNVANATISMLFACLVIVSMLRTPTAARWLSRQGAALASFVVTVFFLYTTSLTGSRSGALLMIVGLLSYAIFTIKRQFVIGLLLVGLVASIIFVVLGPNTSDFVSVASEQSILAKRVNNKGADSDRFYLWLSGLDALADTYGLGTGMSRYPEVHKKYFASYAHLSDERWLDYDLSLHSDYVIALVEHGILGFVLLVLLCQKLFARARAIRDSTVRAVAISILLAMFINGFTHNGMTHFSYWFYFALMASWRAIEQRTANSICVQSNPGMPKI